MLTGVMSGSRQLEMPIDRPVLRARVRADALPEFTRYRDDGCDVHPSCLTCPLPRCRYEEPGGLRALLNAYRDEQIVRLKLSGMAVEHLADRFGVSRRTVFRVLGARSPRQDPTPIRRGTPERKVHCA